MAWTSDVTISGKLAAVGERLIRCTPERLIGQTFECMRTRVKSPHRIKSPHRVKSTQDE